MITIVDYGLGNLGSVVNMLKRIGVASQITEKPEVILDAEKILLPGVGAFDHAMNQINNRGLLPALNKKALEDKVPFLGICLGMQLLTKSSEEGILPGLGFIDAVTTKFKFEDKTLKIPHMGWNIIDLQNPSPLTKGMNEEEYRFYFVHSYYVTCADQKDSLARTPYGVNFDSIIQHGNVFGAQFHPEKSHRFGMKLFSNFAAL